MQLQKSQPAHVADLPATELGGARENSSTVASTAAADSSLIKTPRYPLVPPAEIQTDMQQTCDDNGDIIMHDILQSTPDIQQRTDMEVAVATTTSTTKKPRKRLLLYGKAKQQICFALQPAD